MSTKPLTTEQLKAYKERMESGGLSEVRQVYAELYAQGYNYAGWAAGVANGSGNQPVNALDNARASLHHGQAVANACFG